MCVSTVETDSSHTVQVSHCIVVLLGYETGKLHEGGVVAAADVPARRGLVLDYKYLSVSQILHVA